MDTDKYLSELDTKRFGIKVAKINDYGENPAELLNELSNSDIKLVLSKVNATDIKLLNLLENFGFRIKDAQVTYKYDLTRFDEKLFEYTNDPSIILREHNSGDVGQIVKLTEDSFYNYGHYAADGKMDKQTCLDIYTDWAYRSCTNKSVADHIVVAEIDGKVAGYLSFKIFDEDDKKYAAGGLGAVSKKFRGKDVFRKITIEGLRWGLENNFDWEEHNVLITNHPVNRSFSKLGFVIFKSFYTLHCNR